MSGKGQQQEGYPSDCRPLLKPAYRLYQNQNNFYYLISPKRSTLVVQHRLRLESYNFFERRICKKEKRSVSRLDTSTSPLTNNALSLHWLPALRTDPPSLSVAGRDSAQRSQCLSGTGSDQTNRGLLWPLISRLHAEPVQLWRARLNAWECFRTCVSDASAHVTKWGWRAGRWGVGRVGGLVVCYYTAAVVCYASTHGRFKGDHVRD